MIDHGMNWRRILDGRVTSALAQVHSIQSEIEGQNFESSIVQAMIDPYLEIIKDIYQNEYPLAQALEDSDLVVKLNGEAVDQENPRVSVISAYFQKIRKQVTDLAKVLSHIDSRQRVFPKQFDLTLTAYGRSSVILGFALPTIQELEDASGPSLFKVDDPLYVAAREAMRTLGVVTHVVGSGGSLDDVATAVPDADVRDAALHAIKELAPTGQSGVTSVAIGGKQSGDFGEGRLTPLIRKKVRKDLESPVRGDETITIVGQIREMDLDAKRFELRHILESEVNSVRCRYAFTSDAEAKSWLNRYASLTGTIERDSKGRPKLMDVSSIEAS